MRTAILVSTLAATMIVLSVGCAGTQVDPTTIVPARPLRDNPTRFSFPVGYEEFSPKENFNFLLNRIYSLGYARAEDLMEAEPNDETGAGFVAAVRRLADKAAAEGRQMNAAFLYRAAEFYTPWGDPAKRDLYDRFANHFYQAAQGDGLELRSVPYGATEFSAIRVMHTTSQDLGTIILHGGYDSFKEEFYSIMVYLAAFGYDVINFDVPWMARSDIEDSVGFDYRWERIVGAVLDAYDIDEASIFGISYGGWLALRAAAFEPRLKRVISSSVSFDVNRYDGWFAQKVARFARKHMRGFANKQILKQMEDDEQAFWFFDQLMHVTHTDTPIEAADVLSQINERNLRSDLVTQDVLILTGREDHLVPFKMHAMQVDALVNARSVTPKVFTSEVHGQNHCQIGNIGLALEIVVEWLEDHPIE